MHRPYCFNLLITCLTCLTCSSIVVENIMISSTYTNTQCLRSLNILSTKRWKDCGAVFNPKDIIVYSNSPNGVLIAVFFASSGFI